MRTCTSCIDVHIRHALYRYRVNVHSTENSMSNLLKSNKIWIVNILERLIWHRTEFMLTPIQSEKCDYTYACRDGVLLNELCKTQQKKTQKTKTQKTQTYISYSYLAHV